MNYKKYLCICFLIFFAPSNSFATFIDSSLPLDGTYKTNINKGYIDQIPSDEYILGPGDALQVTISEQYPELNSNLTISAEGTGYFPLIGEKFIKGLTRKELIPILNEAYLPYVKYPNLELKISNFRDIKVFVRGEVGSPGRQVLSGSRSTTNNSPNIQELQDSILNRNLNSFYTASSQINSTISYYFPTLFDVIRASGGITPYSDLTNIELIRKDNLSNGGGKKKAVINFYNYLKNINDSNDLRIYDSDEIIVKKLDKPNAESLKYAIRSNLNPRLIRVFVSGRVVNPGTKTITKSATLNDVIDFAGGVKFIRGKVRFVRVNNDGTLDSRKISYRSRSKRGSYNNPYLENNDLIYVGNNLITNTTQVLNEITSPFSSLLSTYGVIKAIEDL